MKGLMTNTPNKVEMASNFYLLMSLFPSTIEGLDLPNHSTVNRLFHDFIVLWLKNSPLGSGSRLRSHSSYTS